MPNAASQVQVAISQVNYDTLGRPAVSTVAVVKGAGAAAVQALAFEPGLVKSVDLTTGALTGLITTWVDNRFQGPNRSYACNAVQYETSPLSRRVRAGRPGTTFALQTPYATQDSHGGFTDAFNESALKALNRPIDGATVAAINSSANVSQFQIASQLTPLNNTQQVLSSQVADLLGRPVASLSIGPSSPTQGEATTCLLQFSKFDYAPTRDSGAPVLLTETQYLPNASTPDTGVSNKSDYYIAKKYDALGRIVSVRSPDAGVTQSSYDDGGRLRFQQDACEATLKRARCYEYDLQNRMLRAGYLTLTGPWDAGVLAQFQSNPTQIPAVTWLEEYTYDTSTDFFLNDPRNGIGRLLIVTNENQPALESTPPKSAQVMTWYRYTDDGLPVSVRQSIAGLVNFEQMATNYFYNPLGQVTDVQYPLPVVNGKRAPTFQIAYGYDMQGTMTTVGNQSDPVAFGAYTYAVGGQLASETLKTHGGAVVQRAFAYNVLGQLCQIADPKWSEALWYTNPQGTYQAGNITGAKVAFQPITNMAPPKECTTAYGYDAFQRLLKANPSAGAAAQSLNVSGYDADGNMKSAQGSGVNGTFQLETGTNRLQSVTANSSLNYTYYANGRTRTAPGIAALDYDMLTPLPVQFAGTTASSTPTTLLYDYLGRRIRKSPPAAARAQSPDILYFRGGGLLPLVEVLDANSTGQTINTYVYGPTGLIRVANDAAQLTVLKDHLGSPRIMLDAGGAPTAYFDFEAFGNLINDNTQVNGGTPGAGLYRYLFTGQEWDKDFALHGLYNYNARQYDPSLGRFYTPDPAHQFACPYSYVGANPINSTDPTGMMTNEVAMAIFITDPMEFMKHNQVRILPARVQGLEQKLGGTRVFSISQATDSRWGDYWRIELTSKNQHPTLSGNNLPLDSNEFLAQYFPKTDINEIRAAKHRRGGLTPIPADVEAAHYRLDPAGPDLALTTEFSGCTASLGQDGYNGDYIASHFYPSGESSVQGAVNEEMASFASVGFESSLYQAYVDYPGLRENARASVVLKRREGKWQGIGQSRMPVTFKGRDTVSVRTAYFAGRPKGRRGASRVFRSWV